MERRKFIALVGGAAVWPLRANAEEAKPRRVGVLLVGNADLESFQKELRDGLHELGHIEGQNIFLSFVLRKEYSIGFPGWLRSWFGLRLMSL
jgi:putative ABC transport system substrate-binding protein